jgi:hypothetical protein
VPPVLLGDRESSAAPIADAGHSLNFMLSLPSRIDRTLIWHWHALPDQTRERAMNKPSISLMPLQRSGDGRITAFHWVFHYPGAEVQFWILPTELPRPRTIGDFELARLELHRFLEALEEAVDSNDEQRPRFVVGRT